MKSVEKIAWIGLGQMGLPMARNLVKSGCQVTGYDVLPARVELAAAIGVAPASSIGEAVAGAHVVFTMLYDGKVLKSALTGPDGILERIRPGSLLVDMSTIAPQTSAEIAAMIEAKGCRYLRAPVSGSAIIAEAGTLSVFVSGDRQEFENIKPVFKGMSASQDYVGGGEAARVIKLVINMLVASSTATLGEAIRFGEAWSIPRDVLVDAVNSSIVGCRHYQSRAAGLKSRKYTNSGPLGTLLKDVDMVMSDASAKGYKLPIHRFVLSNIAQLVAEGRGNLEASVLAELPRDLPGDSGEITNDVRDVGDIMAADDARYAALLSGDPGRVDPLLSPDLAYTHTKGVCQNKTDYLASFASGQFVYQKFARQSANVSVSCNLAVMQGTVRIDVLVSGEARSMHNRYLAVWERGTDRRWRLKTWMGVPVGEGRL
jgi:3-hydroxyisobutyrate dehydrogenase